MSFIPICKFCLIKIEEDTGSTGFSCEETAAELLNLVNELFEGSVTLTKAELQSLCKSCCFKVKDYHDFHSMVVRNQKTYHEIMEQMCLVETEEAIEDAELLEPFDSKVVVKYEVLDIDEDSGRDYDTYADPAEEYECEEQKPKLKNYRNNTRVSQKRRKSDPNFKLKTGWVQTEEKYNRDMHDFAIIESFYDLSCDKCSDTPNFQTYRELTNHYTKVHSSRKKFVCCDMKFKSRLQLVEHAQAHFNPKVCETCGAQFVREKHFKKHFLQCMARFECDFCHKMFNSKKTISSHLKTSHMEARKVVCEICGKTLNAGAVSNHVRRKHSNYVREQVDCHLCGKTMTKDTFKRHFKDLHDRKEPLVCPYCEKEFEARKNYLRHVRNVHVVGRIHKCTYGGCDKAFHTAEALKEHIATHTGVPLYDCKYCEWSFKSAGNFYAHMRRKHPLEHAQLKEETRRKILMNDN